MNSSTIKSTSKNALRLFISVLLVLIFIAALFASSYRQKNKTIEGLSIHLNDENKFSFLQKQDIENLLITSRNINLKLNTAATLDLNRMEQIALSNPWVAKANIYIDNNQILHIHIVQRDPVARIFEVNNNSYYLDSSLHQMPSIVGYAYPSPLFTNVPVFVKNDSTIASLYLKIAFVSQKIKKSEFWNAQITQINVEEDHSFNISTLLGNQVIKLGDTSNFDQKLNNLFEFYQQVFNKIGWEKYEVLDLRFKNQIITSPSIDYVPPPVLADTSLAIDVKQNSSQPIAKPSQHEKVEKNTHLNLKLLNLSQNPQKLFLNPALNPR